MKYSKLITALLSTFLGAHSFGSQGGQANRNLASSVQMTRAIVCKNAGADESKGCAHFSIARGYDHYAGAPTDKLELNRYDNDRTYPHTCSLISYLTDLEFDGQTIFDSKKIVASGQSSGANGFLRPNSNTKAELRIDIGTGKGTLATKSWKGPISIGATEDDFTLVDCMITEIPEEGFVEGSEED